MLLKGSGTVLRVGSFHRSAEKGQRKVLVDTAMSKTVRYH